MPRRPEIPEVFTVDFIADVNEFDVIHWFVAHDGKRIGPIDDDQESVVDRAHELNVKFATTEAAISIEAKLDIIKRAAASEEYLRRVALLAELAEELIGGIGAGA